MWVNFCIFCEVWIKVHFFFLFCISLSNSSSTTCWKDPFSTASFLRINCLYKCWFSSEHSILLHYSIFLFYTNTILSDYCSLKKKKGWKSDSASLPTLFFLFKIVLDIWDPLNFYMNFRISFKIPYILFCQISTHVFGYLQSHIFWRSLSRSQVKGISVSSVLQSHLIIFDYIYSYLAGCTCDLSCHIVNLWRFGILTWFPLSAEKTSSMLCRTAPCSKGYLQDTSSSLLAYRQGILQI